MDRDCQAEVSINQCVIAHSKSIFAHYRVPETVVSDNGPQYFSEAYSTFAKQYCYQPITQPVPPSGGRGIRERFQTVKNLLWKSRDPYLGILVYHSTPLEVRYSPAELPMGWRLRTTLPVVPEQLTPQTLDVSVITRKDERLK